MGMIEMGVPRELVLDLAKLCNIETFIETGTYRGGTCSWAAEHFKVVHTIERAEQIFQENQTRLADVKGLRMHLGDSRDRLPEIVNELGTSPAIHWLDGHWSGGFTAGEQDECPLIEELACLRGRENDIVLIDDARMILCAPPLPHDASQWPTFPELMEAANSIHAKSFTQVVSDVIIIVPDRDDIRARVIDFARSRAPGLTRQTFRKRLARLIAKKIGG
ncbi:MAG: hypothetical protein AAF802_02540 [Planctomycetota bacterium]